MLVRLLLACLAAAALCLPVAAREEIRAFTSDVTLLVDGSVEVRETIEVIAEGVDIQRGIYRDIPVVMRDGDGNRVRPGLTVMGATRNDNAEPFRVERRGDFLRIWIGDADTLLRPGIHRYALSYTMTRMGRYFADYDEIYWNATGNYWNFPILSALATIRLPEGAVLRDMAGYTGPAGSSERAVTITREADNVAVFRAERALGPGEGLTVAASFQKGILVEPGAGERVAYWFVDRQDAIVPALGALAVLAYFTLAWVRVGRDPQKGVVIPLFHPPKGFSPALVHYIHNWGWTKNGWTAFTAAAFDLGVKGLVVIDNAAKKLKLTATGKVPAEPLPPGEEVLLTYLVREGSATVDKTSGPTLNARRAEFVKAIERENREAWFRNNVGYTILGIVIAVAVIGGIVLLGYLAPFWLILSAVLGIFLGLAVNGLHGLWSGSKIRFVLIAIWAVAFASNFAGGIGALATDFRVSTAVVSAITIVGLCVAFAILMRAPTVQGRKVMDEIDGLKLYLETAEKDRLNMSGEPPLTVERFERLLPYAIALGVEKPWSEHFEAELARNAVPDATGTSYSPGWYHSTGGFSPGKIAGAVAGAATGMSAAMVAAQPASSSSSGSGGGGFS
ncbi:hypothetical protein VE25_19415, partial [Devosia geojensis]